MTSSGETRQRMGTLLMPLLLLLITITFDMTNANQLYSEGGTFLPQDNNPPSPINDSPIRQFEYLAAEAQPIEQRRYQTVADYYPHQVADKQQRRLEKIIEQLQQSSSSPQELADGPGVFVDDADSDSSHQVRNGDLLVDNDWDELKEVEDGGEREMATQFMSENNDQKLAAVKKGQNEFVEFVEKDMQNSQRKTSNWMAKRVPAESAHNGNTFHLFANSSGNILFMAYLAICCAGIVAGTFGGIYYYNHVRASRVDDPFNEFTRYSPAGPGKDKLKKSGTGSPSFGQSGDETLAYKAQLHHYQQQKQKILGTASGAMAENVSDNEEDTDEMDHNYSVFECPGLAPTGDLEIQNPNFTGGEKKVDEQPSRRSE